jgi:hypothetical protein
MGLTTGLRSLCVTQLKVEYRGAAQRLPRMWSEGQSSLASRDCLRPEVPFNGSLDSPLQGDPIRLSALTGGINHTFDD